MVALPEAVCLSGLPVNEVIARDEQDAGQPVFRWPKRVRPGDVLECASQEVVGFVTDGALAGLTESGRHTLTPAELPFLGELEKTIGGETVFDAELWFVSLEPQRCTATGELGEIEDIEFHLPISSSFSVDISVRIMDAETALGEHAGDIGAIPEILRAQLGRLLRLQLRKCFSDDRMSFTEIGDEFFEEAAHVEVLPAVRSAFARHGFAADDLQLDVEPDAQSKRRLDEMLSSIPPALGRPPTPPPPAFPTAATDADDIDMLLEDDQTLIDGGLSSPNIGARVRAQAGNTWYEGVVVELEGERCLVRWDGAPTTWVGPDEVEVIEPGTGVPPPDPIEPAFMPGSVVIAEFDDGNHYRARVLRATSGWYEVEWENGNNAWLPAEKLGDA